MKDVTSDMAHRRLRLIALLLSLPLLLGCFSHSARAEGETGERIVLVTAYSEQMSQEATDAMRQAALDLARAYLTTGEDQNRQVALLDTGSGLNWSGFSTDVQTVRTLISPLRGRGELPLGEILQEALRRLEEEPQETKKQIILLCGLRSENAVSEETLSVCPLTVCCFFQQAEMGARLDTIEQLASLSERFYESRDGVNAADVLGLTELDPQLEGASVGEEPKQEMQRIPTLPQEEEAEPSYSELRISGPFRQIWVYDGETLLLARTDGENEVSYSGSALDSGLSRDGEILLSLEQGKSYQLHGTAVEDGNLYFRLQTDDQIFVAESAMEPDSEILALIPESGEPAVSLDGEALTMGSYEVLDFSDKLELQADETMGSAVLDNDGDPIYYGDFVSVRAQAAEGYEFDGWYLNDTLVSTELEYRSRMTGDLLLEARFRKIMTESEPTEEPLPEESPMPEPEKAEEEKKIPWGLIIGLPAAGAALLAAGAVLLLTQKRRTKSDSRISRELDIRPALSDHAPGHGERRPNPTLVVMSGPMKGKRFPLTANMVAMVGTDAESCQIVLDPKYEYLSRCHCSILYDSDMQRYLVTDSSTNGVYTTDRRRLPKGRQAVLEPRTVLLLANSDCTITLT